ncbi:hypothetical protein NFJ02_16g23720 [Pycnococcus provasolii]
MAAPYSVMEPGPSTGSMVVGDNDDNNNDDILTRAEAIELEEIARSPEHNKESREIAATLLQNDAQSRLTNVIAVTNGEASPSVADRMLNAAERRVNHSFAVRTPDDRTIISMAAQKSPSRFKHWLWDSCSQLHLTGDINAFTGSLEISDYELQGAVPGVSVTTYKGEANVQFVQSDGSMSPPITVIMHYVENLPIDMDLGHAGVVLARVATCATNIGTGALAPVAADAADAADYRLLVSLNGKLPSGRVKRSSGWAILEKKAVFQPPIGARFAGKVWPDDVDASKATANLQRYEEPHDNRKQAVLDALRRVRATKIAASVGFGAVGATKTYPSAARKRNRHPASANEREAFHWPCLLRVLRWIC